MTGILPELAGAPRRGRLILETTRKCDTLPRATSPARSGCE
jgi:hypothetical protein